MNEKHLYSSLEIGETSGSFTDETIIDSSVIEIYFDNTDCYLDSIYQNGHTVYYTVGGNATGTNVCLCIDNLSNFAPYDDEGISARVDGIEEDIKSINTEIETLDETLSERVPDETLLGGVLYHGTTGNTWKKLNANNLDYDENSTIYSAMGDIDSLDTTSKNLVGAINEVKSSGGGSQSEVYDNTERTIGTWFGKPLYRKCYVFTQVNAENTYDISSLNIEDLVNIKGTLLRQISILQYKPIQYRTEAPENANYGINLELRNDTLYLELYSYPPSEIKKINIVLEYTKVGD